MGVSALRWFIFVNFVILDVLDAVNAVDTVDFIDAIDTVKTAGTCGAVASGLECFTEVKKPEFDLLNAL